ncbi:MAG: hypothetical protein ACK5LX_15320 [Oscillospiraceae bacterium]
MKRIALVFLTLLFVAAASFSAFGSTVSSSASSPDAAVSSPRYDPEAAPPKIWRITLRARVLSNRGDSLAVWLYNPPNMKIEERDTVFGNVQTIPFAKELFVTDEAGKALSADKLLPGQEITLRFLFYWEPEKFWEPDGARRVQMQSCDQIKLRGETFTAKSTQDFEKLPDATSIGTVLKVEGDKVTIYLEGLLAVYSTNPTRQAYFHSGSYTITVNAATKIKSADGKTLSAGDLKPFQRVKVTVANEEWMETYPPVLSISRAVQIEVVGDGELIVSPAQLREQLDRMETLFAENKATAG